MDKMSVLQKLETMLDTAKNCNQFGSIELRLESGEVVVIHETKTLNLKKEGNPYGRFERR